MLVSGIQQSDSQVSYIIVHLYSASVINMGFRTRKLELQSIKKHEYRFLKRHDCYLQPFFFVIVWCVFGHSLTQAFILSVIYVKIQGSQLCSVPAHLMDKCIPISDNMWESESSEGLLV